MSHPDATMFVMGMTSIDFGLAARFLARAARLRGLIVPVFASPPPRADLDRSIRRREGSPVVSVRLRERPRSAVLADMIEGIVVANDLSGSRADLARSALWLAVKDEVADTDDVSTRERRPRRTRSVGTSAPSTLAA